MKLWAIERNYLGILVDAWDRRVILLSQPSVNFYYASELR